jgi:hypothetical protein
MRFLLLSLFEGSRGGEPYRDEISHGEVVCQGRHLLVLALELCAAGYHQFFC